ncbi:MAG: NADPH-dependent F420 reductase [Gemmatimonadota bacterium]
MQGFGNMRIAILGSGNMGAILGRRFAGAGHSVTFTFSRDPAKLERLARQSGDRARASESIADAVRDADVVLLAVHWNQVNKVLRAAGNLRGKVLIDVTNPMNDADEELAIGFRTSGSEHIARRAGTKHIVKAFNTVPSELLRAGADALAERPSVCYCSDDARAKRVVTRLIREIGFEPVNCGPLRSARHLEPLAMIVVELAYNQRRRPEVGIRFLRPQRKVTEPNA